MHLHVAHLYPFSMNTYGDDGNIICLKQRARWRGIDITVHQVDSGTPLPSHVDLYFFGGGQDISQESVARDLQTKADRIRHDVKKNVPLLSVCGGYQLLGAQYVPFDQPPITGIGIFPVETRASNDRMIGNLLIKADSYLNFGVHPKTLVGFENHSGKTFIQSQKATPLGKILHGHGNNGSDKTEGCIIHNAIGCYLHGSLLPKNPHLADWLLQKACDLHYPGYFLNPLDDTLEWRAHESIVARYI